jgi:hypothetical protein
MGASASAAGGGVGAGVAGAVDVVDAGVSGCGPEQADAAVRVTSAMRQTDRVRTKHLVHIVRVHVRVVWRGGQSAVGEAASHR